MSKFWEQYDRAFGNAHVQGYALIKDGEPIGSVAIKYSKDGAGKLQVFVWIVDSLVTDGKEDTIAVKGWASGYGYDKTSAAVQSALKGTRYAIPSNGEEWQYALKINHGVTAFATISR